MRVAPICSPCPPPLPHPPPLFPITIVSTQSTPRGRDSIGFVRRGWPPMSRTGSQSPARPGIHLLTARGHFPTLVNQPTRTPYFARPHSLCIASQWSQASKSSFRSSPRSCTRIFSWTGGPMWASWMSRNRLPTCKAQHSMQPVEKEHGQRPRNPLCLTSNLLSKPNPNPHQIILPQAHPHPHQTVSPPAHLHPHQTTAPQTPANFAPKPTHVSTSQPQNHPHSHQNAPQLHPCSHLHAPKPPPIPPPGRGQQVGASQLWPKTPQQPRQA